MSAISSRVGGPPRSSRSDAASRIPGVQKPHWSAWFARNASWSLPQLSPSTVVIAAPSAVTASSRQERTATPSSRTVQAPQTPCSQPTWVPVSRRSWRRSEEHTSELQSPYDLVCRLLLEKKKKQKKTNTKTNKKKNNKKKLTNKLNI